MHTHTPAQHAALIAWICDAEDTLGVLRGEADPDDPEASALIGELEHAIDTADAQLRAIMARIEAPKTAPEQACRAGEFLAKPGIFSAESAESGGQGGNRTPDTRIFNQLPDES